MSRVFNGHVLSTLSNLELISLVTANAYTLAPSWQLIEELSERLEEIDYMVQQTLEGQEVAKYPSGLVGDPQ